MKYGAFIIILAFFFAHHLLAETQINNDISGNVQWLRSNSPYIINRSIKINYGSTLNIESGSEILLKNDVKVIAEGTINVSGDDANYVVFNGYNGANWDYLEIKNKAVISYLELKSGGSKNLSPLLINGNKDIVVNNLSLSDNVSNTIGLNTEGASNIFLNNLGYDYLINKNLIINEYNTVWIDESVNISFAKDVLLRIKGKIYANGIADEPIIFKGFSGKWGGLYFDEGSEGKFTFTEFYNGGASVLTQNSVILTNGGQLSFELCTFENSQSSAITILNSMVLNFSEVGYNRFINFKKPYYAITNLSTSDIHASNNCFGTQDSSKIDAMIYDGKDRSGKGSVKYLPIAESCDLQLPDQPELIAPLNNSIDIPINLNLRWRNNIFANHYQFRIYGDTDLTNPLKSATIKDTIISIFNLDYGATYYWEVSAVNSKGESDFSELFSFVTYDTSKPKSPDIIFPNENDTVNCSEYFLWNNVKNADKYYIEISKDIDFNNVIYSDSTAKYDTLKYAQLELDGNYYWRIKARNRNGVGNWSKIVNFSTKPLLHLVYSFEFGRDLIDLVIINHFGNQFAVLSKDNSNYYIDLIDSSFNISNIYESEHKINDFLVYDVDNDNTLEYVIFHDNFYILQDENRITIQKAAFKPQFIDFNNDTKIDLIYYTDSLSNNLSIDFDILNNGLTEHLTNNISDNYFIYDVDRNSFFDVLTFSDDGLICLLNDGNNFTEYLLSDNISQGLIYAKNNDFTANIDISIYNNEIHIFEINNELSIVNHHTHNTAANNIVFNNITASKHDNMLFLNDGKINIFDDYFSSNLIFQGDNYYDNFRFNPSINQHLIAWINNELHSYSINKCQYDESPESAQNLRYTYSKDDIILEWSHSSDENTQSKSMKYVIEIINDNTKEYALSSLLIAGKHITDNYINLKNIASGKYLWRVTSIDNAGNSTISDDSYFRTKDFSAGPPEAWYFEKKTGTNSLLILRSDVQPKFNDRLLVSGDAIGVFYFRDSSLVCGGYGIWDDNHNMPITAWGDNYQTENIKDGFEYAEDYRFKFWDSFLEKEYDISFNIQSGLSFFKPDTVTILGSIVEPDTQSIILYPNTVNLISSAIIPYNNSVNILFKSQQVNGIQDGSVSDRVAFWKSNSGYEIYTDNLDTITFTGTLINQNNFSVAITKNQWQLIPNPLKFNILIDSLFKNRNVILINDRGEIYWDYLNIREFDILQSTRAVYCYSFDEFTLNYNTLEYASNLDSNDIPDFTANFQLLLIEFDTILNSIVNIKDKHKNIITEKFINDNTALFLIKGADSLANYDALDSGNDLYLFYEENSVDLPITITKIINLRDSILISDLNFIRKSVCKISANVQNTSITENIKKNLKIYPNPAKDALFFENNADNTITAYYLYDTNGRIILSNYCNCVFSEIDLSGISPGRYTLRLNYSKINIDINLLIIK